MTTAEARVEGQSAYVLHSRPYRDDSALVDLFTADFGRVRAVARGARKPRSRLREGTRSLQPLDVAWYGRGDLKTLTGAESQGAAPLHQGQSLWCGLYLNELVMRLLPAYDPHPRLFAYYRLALGGLADPDTREPVLRVFEGRLLDALGFGFSLEQTTEQQPLRPEGRYRLDPEQGLIRDGQGPYGGEALLAMAADDYTDAATRRCAKQLMRQALAPLLGERPLHSRSLFAAAAPAGRGRL